MFVCLILRDREGSHLLVNSPDPWNGQGCSQEWGDAMQGSHSVAGTYDWSHYSCLSAYVDAGVRRQSWEGDPSTPVWAMSSSPAA